MNSNQYQSKIHSFIRIRPLINNAESIVFKRQGDNSIISSQTNDQYIFVNIKKEQVFDSGADNYYVFEQTGQMLVMNSLQGINGCMFAYGQTNSGKTHTIRGSNDQPGMIMQTIKMFFEQITKKEGCQAKVEISYFEIYQEKINDLLAEKGTSGLDLQIREPNKANIYIENLTSIEVQDHENAMLLLQIFQFRFKILISQVKKEKKKENIAKLNQIITLLVLIQFLNLEQKFAILIILGYQQYRFQTSLTYVEVNLLARLPQQEFKNIKQIIRESGSINKSLLALSAVVEGLSQMKSFINYRDSKLTRVLEAQLSGNCETIVLGTVSPNQINFQETLKTLSFCLNAGTIKKNVQINYFDNSSNQSFTGELNQYNENIKNLEVLICLQIIEIQFQKDENEMLKEELEIKNGKITGFMLQSKRNESIIENLEMKIKHLQNELNLKQEFNQSLLTDNKRLTTQNYELEQLISELNQEQIKAQENISIIQQYEDQINTIKQQFSQIQAELNEFQKRSQEEQVLYENQKKEFDIMDQKYHEILVKNQQLEKKELKLLQFIQDQDQKLIQQKQQYEELLHYQRQNNSQDKAQIVKEEFSLKIIQQNQTINKLDGKVNLLECKLREKDKEIFDLQNKLTEIKFKNAHNLEEDNNKSEGKRSKRKLGDVNDENRNSLNMKLSDQICSSLQNESRLMKQKITAYEEHIRNHLKIEDKLNKEKHQLSNQILVLENQLALISENKYL